MWCIVVYLFCSVFRTSLTFAGAFVAAYAEISLPESLKGFDEIWGECPTLITNNLLSYRYNLRLIFNENETLLGITKLDKEKNQCIRQKTGAQNIVKEIKQYQKKWLQHVQRMDTNRLPKQALQYKPEGRRNIGRPRKRWRDQLHLEEQGRGNTPSPSGTWRRWWFNEKQI